MATCFLIVDQNLKTRTYKPLGTQVQNDAFSLLVFHSFKIETNYFPDTKLRKNYF